MPSQSRFARQLLLRLAVFCSAGRCPLAKTGALRHSQLPVSAAGSGRCSCPRTRGSQNVSCRLLPPTFTGEVDRLSL